MTGLGFFAPEAHGTEPAAILRNPAFLGLVSSCSAHGPPRHTWPSVTLYNTTTFTRLSETSDFIFIS
jgi:hypothetical protein